MAGQWSHRQRFQQCLVWNECVARTLSCLLPKSSCDGNDNARLTCLCSPAVLAVWEG